MAAFCQTLACDWLMRVLQQWENTKRTSHGALTTASHNHEQRNSFPGREYVFSLLRSNSEWQWEKGTRDRRWKSYKTPISVREGNSLALVSCSSVYMVSIFYLGNSYLSFPMREHRAVRNHRRITITTNSAKTIRNTVTHGCSLDGVHNGYKNKHNILKLKLYNFTCFLNFFQYFEICFI